MRHPRPSWSRIYPPHQTIHKEILCISTDGSKKYNEVGYAIFAGPGSDYNCIVQLEKHATCAEAELLPIIRALASISDEDSRTKQIVILTDYKFLLRALEELEYKRKNNRAPKPSSHENFNNFKRDHHAPIEEIYRLAASFSRRVYFVHVPAHANIRENETVDIMANMSTHGHFVPDLTHKMNQCIKNNRRKATERKRTIPSKICIPKQALGTDDRKRIFEQIKKRGQTIWNSRAGEEIDLQIWSQLKGTTSLSLGALMRINDISTVGP